MLLGWPPAETESQVLLGELLSSAGASWLLLIENDRDAGMRAGRFPPAAPLASEIMKDPDFVLPVSLMSV